MAIPQQKFREIVFQLLYSIDIAQASKDEMEIFLMKELSVTKKTVKEAQKKVDQILINLPEIDTLIRNTSVSFRFERIQSIERNVLMLGVFEILYDETIPPKVAIAEAMRLSKKFSTPESATFVNALLDAIYKTSLGEQHDKEKLEETAEELRKSEERSLEASHHELTNEKVEDPE